jgi:hypothetical protein
MAKIAFSKGDKFSFKGGYGVVLSESQAFVITNKDNRCVYDMSKGAIPEGALPLSDDNSKDMPFEVRTVLRAVECMIK